MQNIHQITLDIFKESLKPSITITQNDIDVNKLVVSVTQNKKTFDLGNLVPILVCLKPSTKYTINVMNIVDNKLEFTLTQQEVVEAGKVEFAILLHGVDGSRVSTMKFEMKVLNELVTLETIESQINTEPLLNRLIMQIESKRDKNIPIGELDLSLELLNKINGSNYDDSELRDALSDKRDKSVKIAESDLDTATQNKINKIYDDTDLKNQLADKRDKAVKINKEDLSQEVLNKLNNVGINGLSAYELAVENGYTGTEQEWIAQIDEMKMAIEDLQKNGGTTSIKESINIMLINDTNITAFESLPIVTMQDELKNITLEV